MSVNQPASTSRHGRTTSRSTMPTAAQTVLHIHDPKIDKLENCGFKFTPNKLTNGGTSSLSIHDDVLGDSQFAVWEISGNPGWMTVTPSTGGLANGASVDVDFSGAPPVDYCTGRAKMNVPVFADAKHARRKHQDGDHRRHLRRSACQRLPAPHGWSLRRSPHGVVRWSPLGGSDPGRVHLRRVATWGGLRVPDHRPAPAHQRPSRLLDRTNQHHRSGGRARRQPHRDVCRGSCCIRRWCRVNSPLVYRSLSARR